MGESPPMTFSPIPLTGESNQSPRIFISFEPSLPSGILTETLRGLYYIDSIGAAQIAAAAVITAKKRQILI